MRDRPLDPVALDLLSRATLCQMRDDADELAALVAGLNEPLPRLTDVSMLKLYRLRGPRAESLPPITRFGCKRDIVP